MAQNVLPPETPTPPPAPAAPPAAPAAPPPSPQAKAKGDPKALAEFTSKWLNLSASKLPPKKEGEEPTPPAAEPTSEDTPAPEAPPAATPPPKKPRKAAPPPAPSVEQVIEATAQGVARAMADKPAGRSEEPPPEPKPEDGLPSDEQLKIETLRVMEKLYPERYKGITEKYATGVKAALEYVSKWERDHPGETFDENDEEHAAFFDQNNVDWDDEHYTDARAEMRAEKRVAQATGELKGQLTEIERREKAREAAPIVDAHQAMTARHFFSLVDERLGAIIKEDGSVDHEALKQLQEEEPMLTDLVVHGMSAQQLEPLAGEIYRLYEGLTNYDPKRPDHAYLGKFAVEMEDKLLKMPPQNRLNEQGQSFATAQEYQKMTAAERKRHWTFGHMDLSILLADKMAQDAKKMVEMESKRFESWAKRKKGSGAPPSEEPGEEPPEPPDNTRGKPRSPTAVATPKLAAGAAGSAGTASSDEKAFVSRFLGGR